MALTPGYQLHHLLLVAATCSSLSFHSRARLRVARQDPHLLTEQPVLAVDRTATSSVWKEEVSSAIGWGKKKKKKKKRHKIYLRQSMWPTWKEASEGHTMNSTSGQDRLHHFQVVHVLSLSQEMDEKQAVSPKKLHRSAGIQLSIPV